MISYYTGQNQPPGQLKVQKVTHCYRWQTPGKCDRGWLWG